MSKKIIKKISLILLIALSISFVGLNSAKAEEYSVVCSYDNGKIEIGFYGVGAMWEVRSSKIIDKYDYFSALFSGKKKLYMGKSTRDELVNFKKCPNYAYISDPFFGSNKICFDNGKYCNQYHEKTFGKEDAIQKTTDNTKKIKNSNNNSTKSDLLKYKAETNCEGILGTKVINWLQKLFNIVKIVAPLLVLGLTIFEFAKAVISQDQDALKKAGNIFVQRLIIMIVLFFLPTIINLLLDLLDNTNGTCNIK